MSPTTLARLLATLALAAPLPACRGESDPEHAAPAPPATPAASPSTDDHLPPSRLRVTVDTQQVESTAVRERPNAGDQ